MDLDMIPSMAPPPGVIPNFINPVTLANPILSVCITTSVLAVILLCMRLYSTTRITRSASYDDAAVVIALLLSLCYAGLVISVRDKARHGWDLPLSAYTVSLAKIIFTEQIFAALSLLFSKASILLLLFRLFAPTRWFRHMIYLGIAWATLISLVSIIVASVLCVPRHGEGFADLTVAERCVHETTWAVVQGASDVVLDFFIIYLPIPMLWKLNMGLQRKIGVMAIFLTGFVYALSPFATLLPVYQSNFVPLTPSPQCLHGQHPSPRLQSKTIPKLRHPLEHRSNLHPQVSPSLPILSITTYSPHPSIIELNVAIMVACMPACACLFRYSITKFHPISTLKTRFSSQQQRSSSNQHQHHKFSHSRASTIVASAGRASESYGDDKKTNHWRIKNPFSSTVPPQITMMDHTRSSVMKTVDFDVFDEERKEFAKPKPESGSIELKDMGSDVEKGSAMMKPFDMV